MTSALSIDLDGASAAEVLSAISAEGEAARQAEVRRMIGAIAWAEMHPADSLEDAASVPGTDRGLAVAGEGAPLVSDFAVVELAATLHRTADSARIWLGQVMEIRYRLPLTWQALVAGPLEPWRALAIARQTLLLPVEAAAWVDEQVVERAQRVGPVVLDRLVTEAAERFAPDMAYEEEGLRADRRGVTVEADQIHGGCVTVDAVLDAADAKDLDAAIAKVANELLGTGVGGARVTAEIRRALALGEIARRELGRDGDGSRRDLTIYAHVDADAVEQEAGEPSWARVESGSSSFTLSLDRLREWLTVPGAQVVIRPVIDLPATASVNGYEATDRMREHVVLRRSVCAFPWCGRSARRADLDHIEPYDPCGPPGQTNTENLAPCCRRHHRSKTHAGWTYTQLAPGEYFWTGPNGQRFHVDGTGTTEL